MARTPRSVARRRAMAIVTVGATIASGSALLAPGTSLASSHREAPYISSDPAVDNTDVYAFNDRNDSSKVNFIANWAPFSDPAGGPTFYPWATDAAYDIDIDNNGDAKADVIYRWEFTNVDKRGTADHGDGRPPSDTTPSTPPGTFLYADGPVTSLTDKNLLFKQTYKLTELDASPSGTVTANGGAKFTPKTLVAAGTAAPSNIGHGTMPDYASLRRAAVGTGTFTGGKSYVGQADDPFFLDLRVFDLLYGGPGSNFFESGNDTLKHYNVNTIALQVPKADVALAGLATAAGNPTIGVWSTTSRQATRVFGATNDPSKPVTTDSGAYAQLSRLGNPLVNEVVVPAQLKDTFNRITPEIDASVKPVVDKVLDPEVPYLVKGIYGVPNVNTYNPTSGSYDGVKRDRTDLFKVFLTGLSGLNNINDNKVHATQRPAEYLRLNLSTPIAKKENRLGVIGGDAQGFPNGRRLGDDITDIVLRVAEGTLIYGNTAKSADAKAYAAAVAGLGDGVNTNDKPFLTSFPYIADPTSGSAVTQVKPPVRFYQNLMSYRGKVYIAVGGVYPAQPGGTMLIYRKNTDGSTTLIRKGGLNAAGTTSATTTVDTPSASAHTVYYRIVVIPKGLATDTVPATNYGMGTNITINR